MADGWCRSVAIALVFFATAASALQFEYYFPPECSPATGYFRYPNENCQLYYACDQGTLETLSCPFGEFFDRLLLECRPAILVDCHLIPLPTQAPTTVATEPPERPSSTTPSTRPTSTRPTTTTCRPTSTTRRTTPTTPTTTTTARPTVCPPTGNLLTPTGDCVTYYNCTNGRLENDTCPPGQLFDPQALACLPYTESSCLPVTTTSAMTTRTTPATTTTTTPRPPILCPPTGTQIIPTGDCVTYYQCTNGVFSNGTCGPGQLLDPSSLTCQPYYEVTCTPVTTQAPATTTTTRAPLTCPAQGTPILPTGDCVSYYQCFNGIGILETCPSGDLLDPDSLQCLPSSQVNCVPTS